MLQGEYATAYKTGVNNGTVQWDITFNSVDFQNVLANAYIDGPFSLVVDVDASQMGYPLLIGIELRGVGKSISVADRVHIAGVSRERRVIGPASVPQLAYIDGLYDTIIVKCYGYTSGDASGCKVSLRIAPAAKISAPPPLIGRDTLVIDPGIYFSVDSGDVFINAGAVDVTLFSIVGGPNVPRLRIKSVMIKLPPTPSFVGDLEARLEITTRFATIEEMGRVNSSDVSYTHFYIQPELILDTQYGLRVLCNNNNPFVARDARAAVSYLTVY